RFQYGKSQLTVPYASITTTEVTEPTGMHLWRVPVPKVGKGARFLNISYRDGENTRMMTFKAPAGTVSGLANTINQKRKDPKLEISAKASKPAASPEKPSKHVVA